MAHIKGYSLCKVLAIVLSVLIAGQAHFAISGRSQEETPGAKFEAARVAYLDGKYEEARVILAGLAADTAETEESRMFLGGVYLLLAASEENLGRTEEARGHYAKARELLGEKEASVAGVNFAGLGLYLELFAPKVQKDQAAVLNERLDGAKNLFFSGDFEGAKAEAEKIAAEFASLEGFDVLKGETYLLLGAAHEKLKDKELAVKHYCRAKEILGVNKTFVGLELKKLKYYKEECRAVAGRTAARRGGGFLGKALGTLLFLGALGGLVWYLFFSPNAPLKAKGEYTSVTVKVDVTYKGLNSKGTRTLTFDGVERLNEPFLYTQPSVPCTTTEQGSCSSATQSESYSFTIETNGKSLDIIQRYINWDYYSCGMVCCKVLCADWNFTVTDYKWESGKRDPGSPSIEGTDELEVNQSTDCTPLSQWVHNCTTEAHLTFKAPGAGVQVQKAFSAHQTLNRSN